MTEIKVKEMTWATNHDVKMESESFLHTWPLLVSGLFWHAASSSSGKLRMGLCFHKFIKYPQLEGTHKDH